MKRQLKKYLQKRVGKLIGLLNEIPGKCSVDYFHSIRIEIKRIKALFKLIDFSCHHFPRKKVFEPFKQIFAITGKIREVHVEQLLVTEYVAATNFKYKTVVDRNLQRHHLGFEELLKTNILKRIVRRVANAEEAIESMHKKNLSVYLTRVRKKIEKYLNHNQLREDKVHKLRTLLKEYYYNQKGLKDIVPFEWCSAKKMELFQKLLGKWHDQQVAFNHLTAFAALKGHTPQYIGEVRIVLEKMAIKKAQILNKINFRIKKFL